MVAPTPERAAEADAVCRVFGHIASERRRYIMSAEQRAAVLAYIDAVLLEVGRCIDLEDYAPSPTLGQEARKFVNVVTEMRRAATVPPKNSHGAPQWRGPARAALT